MSDNHSEIKYYNAILPIYIFLLIFLIILVTQTHVNKKLNPQIMAAVEQTFIKTNDTPKWFNIFNDFLMAGLLPQKNINEKEFKSIFQFSKINFVINQTIDKEAVYIWSLSKEDLFNIGTEYISYDYKIFLEELVNLLKTHEQDYMLKISWDENVPGLDRLRIEKIYNFLKDNYEVEQISLNIIDKLEQKIIFSLVPKD